MGWFEAGKPRGFKTVVSDNLLKADDGDVTISTTTYVKKKELTIPLEYWLANVNLRVKFSLMTEEIVTYGSYGRIYVNGVAVGTEQYCSSGCENPNYQEFSEDIINLESGDLVQFYGKLNVNGADKGHIKNFRLYGTEQFITKNLGDIIW